ncbi:cytochrome P450 3A27-like [Takifugu flavidus]|uniref:cytochrome P450 3A27-like n=1 Tax=Takifugu flavidus TaxID=433684 RepID=UPI002544A14E|nr:cytochrome P450 3A27-like [Takifugu flavidus]
MNFLPDFFLNTWTLLILVIILSTTYGCSPYVLFKRGGIRGPTPWPFIGTYLQYKTGLLDFYTECCKRYGKVWGLYEGRIPVMFIVDTAMIKTVFVKEGYSVFLNRKSIGPNGILSTGLPFLRDDNWKRVHKIVSPAFSSGRMKDMFSIMLQHSNILMGNIRGLEDKGAVNIRQMIQPYTANISFAIFFSIDIESLNNPSSPFLHYLQEVSKYNYMNLWRLLVIFPFLTPLMDKMNITVNSSETLQFFISVIKKIKEERKNKPKDRVDFMQLMLNAQAPDGSNKDCDSAGLSDEEIMVQALIFALVGNGNMAYLVAFTAYNLAVHPQTQTRLQAEIDRTFPGKCPITYEELLQMKYLDMVVTETSRLYPLGNRIERVAKSTVEVSGVIIPEGVVVAVPIYTLHRDPTVWPDPDSFKPERFSKDNRDNIDPYGLLTFGAGPRSCTGTRMSMLVVKLTLVEILQHFSFVACKETMIPMVLDDNGFVQPKTPIMLKLEPREPAA